MTLRFFLSYARDDDDSFGRRPITDFFEHLKKEVAQVLGSGRRHDEIGFIDREIPTAEQWRHHISDGLARAQVLLCLVSPNFLASEPCGREWSFFERRIREADGKNRILPVFWRTIGSRPLPECIAQIQYRFDGGTNGLRRMACEQYDQQGLRSLALGAKHEPRFYQVLVEEIAQRIAELSADPLPDMAERDIPELDAIEPKFPESASSTARSGNKRTRTRRRSDPPVSVPKADEDDHEFEVDEWTAELLGEQTAAAATRSQAMVEAIGELTGRSPRWVRRDLNAANGRTLVRSVFEGHWPEPSDDDDLQDSVRSWDLDELGSMTTASCRAEPTIIAAIAKVTGVSRRQVREVLAEWDGRYRIRTVFADWWPDGPGEHESEPTEWNVDELGEQTAAAARDDDEMLDAIATVTEISRRWVRRKLNAAHGRSKIRNVFAGYWADDSTQSSRTWSLDELGVLTAAAARRDSEIIDAIAAEIPLSKRWIKRLLNAAGSRTHVKNALADYWPELEDAERTAALGSMSCAAVRDDEELIEEIADLLGVSRRTVRRAVTDEDGRARISRVFEDRWP